MLFTTWHIPDYYSARRFDDSTFFLIFILDPLLATLSVRDVAPSRDVCHGPCHGTQMTSSCGSLVPSVLQCVAVCCGVLQCVAVRRSALQCAVQVAV